MFWFGNKKRIGELERRIDCVEHSTRGQIGFIKDSLENVWRRIEKLEVACASFQAEKPVRSNHVLVQK